ncbi:MAG: hypothetical protein Q8P67_16020 [archaeon]|nr:hypothetical protein [archaeon]
MEFDVGDDFSSEDDSDLLSTSSTTSSLPSTPQIPLALRTQTGSGPMLIGGGMLSLPEEQTPAARADSLLESLMNQNPVGSLEELRQETDFSLRLLVGSLVGFFLGPMSAITLFMPSLLPLTCFYRVGIISGLSINFIFSWFS